MKAAALRLQTLDRTLAAEQGIAAATTSSAKFKPYASPSLRLRQRSSSMFTQVQHAELLQEWFIKTRAAWFQNPISSMSTCVCVCVSVCVCMKVCCSKHLLDISRQHMEHQILSAVRRSTNYPNHIQGNAIAQTSPWSRLCSRHLKKGLL